MEYVKTGEVEGEFHRHLIDAQEARLAGDYAPLQRYTAEDALRFIGYAEYFIALGERLLSESPSQGEEVDDDAE